MYVLFTYKSNISSKCTEICYKGQVLVLKNTYNLKRNKRKTRNVGLQILSQVALELLHNFFNTLYNMNIFIYGKNTYICFVLIKATLIGIIGAILS